MDTRRVLHLHAVRLKLVRERRMVGGPEPELPLDAPPDPRRVIPALAWVRPTRIGGAA